MATTKESIARLVLQNLGVSVKVTSIASPMSHEEKSIAAIYDKSRDYVLSDFPWPFCTEFIALGNVDGTNGDPVNTEWTFAYAIPAGCLTVRRIVPAEGRMSARKIPFLRGRHSGQPVLFADEESATIEMTAAITDENLFDDHFIEALAWRIAAKLAPAFSQIKDHATTCFNMYEMEKGRAAARAIGEAQPDAPDDAELIRARD